MEIAKNGVTIQHIEWAWHLAGISTVPLMAIALKKYKNSVIPAQAGTHSSMAFDGS